MPVDLMAPQAGTWRMDVALPISYPTRIYVRSACHGVIALADLEDGLHVAALKHMLYERLMLKPSQSVRLVSWGRELVDSEPLSTYALQTNARLEMHTSLCKPEPRELRRVRVYSTALKTRQYEVDAQTTVFDLKKKIETSLMKGDHEWFGSDGVCTRFRGATLVATAAAKADEKAGTATVTQGLEVVVEGHFDGGKKAGMRARKAANGLEVDVPSDIFAALALPPPKQRLLYLGRTLEETEVLGGTGVTHDCEVTLEFESPAMPDVLRRIRSGEAGGKKEKGGKKKEGGKGKKKK
jgi:hypothetical protein